MALTDKLTNIANAIREKTGSTRTMNLEEMAAAVTNIKIPTALSDLNEDETHRTVTDAEKKTWNNKSNFSGNYDDLKNKPTIPTIPEKLPNPNALTFTGAVEGSYDGSAPLSVEIPSGGGESIVTATKLHEITLEEEVTSISETLPFNPMDCKKIIILCDFVSSTTNTSKVQVRINLGGLMQWIPSWLNYNAVQKFHARCDYDIQSGLNMLTIYYSNNYNELSGTPLTFNSPRYNYTSNDLTNTFAVTTQNKYLGVGTKFEFWGIK